MFSVSTSDYFGDFRHKFGVFRLFPSAFGHFRVTSVISVTLRRSPPTSGSASGISVKLRRSPPVPVLGLGRRRSFDNKLFMSRSHRAGNGGNRGRRVPRGFPGAAAASFPFSRSFFASGTVKGLAIPAFSRRFFPALPPHWLGGVWYVLATPPPAARGGRVYKRRRRCLRSLSRALSAERPERRRGNSAREAPGRRQFPRRGFKLAPLREGVDSQRSERLEAAAPHKPAPCTAVRPQATAPARCAPSNESSSGS